jgi:glycosyltransferase involved in cell wall biosynthesis
MSNLAVLIPVYQNQQGLERSLRSLQEARGAFDVVVVDDGSPNLICVPSFLRDDVSVFLLRFEKNEGIAAALNHGLRHILARGYLYIARLDAGDTIVSKRFEYQTRVLGFDPSCAVVGSFIEFTDETQERLFCYYPPREHKHILQGLHLNNCLIHSGSMIRASALEDVGVYSEDFLGAEDYELFLRISKRYTLAVVPEILTSCEYRLGGLSVAGRRNQQKARLRLQLQYFDLRCPFSYYGVARTLVAMLAPHAVILPFKVAIRKGVDRRKPCTDLAP